MKTTNLFSGLLILVVLSASAQSQNVTISDASSTSSLTADATAGVADLSADSCCSKQCCLGGCSDCGGGGLLGGLIAPSDRCFDRFVSPMTNPVYFEDPRTLTEVRAIFLRHKVPLAATGGEVHLFAAQMRAALTDNISLIATKDGYITSTNPLIDDGWADIAAGLKFNLFKDYENQRLLSAGLLFELPVGSTRSQQGNGGGLFNAFVSGGMELSTGSHWVSTAGLLLPTDRSEESSLAFWSNHIDHQLGCSNLYVLAETNWYHYMGSGRRFNVAPIEGGDLFNFGTIGVAGNDIVTGAFGLKWKPRDRMEIGIAWEAPLTDRRDVLDNRLTFDTIVRY